MHKETDTTHTSGPIQTNNGSSTQEINDPASRITPHGFIDPGDIVVRGARQHNLKGIDITFPRNRFIVVTGVSGSGKSSLAMDTLYAEGQRRYVESLSSYARQFVGQMENPKVDQIAGLSPAIAIGQKTVSRNPRSTVGTVTEVMDYLRVLYARLGTAHCPSCGRPVIPQSPLQISNQLLALPPETRFQLLAPVVRGRKGTQRKLLGQARRDGYRHVRIDGQAMTLEGNLPQLEKTKKHTVELIVDRLVIPTEADGEFRQRLVDSVETALNAGEGLLVVDLDEKELLFSEHNACPECDISFPELSPNLFSFNSPFGMCPDCNGLGQQMQVDVNLIISDPHLSLLDGASPYFGELRKKQDSWTYQVIRGVAAEYDADLALPWQELPQRFRQILLYGSDGEQFNFKFENEARDYSGEWRHGVEGAVNQITRFFRQTRSEYRRRFLSGFMSRQSCPTCEGERLCPEARFVTVGGKRLPELLDLNIRQAFEWASGLRFAAEQQEVAVELVKEVADRLQFMLNVGLHYLTLNRSAPTLSGGESQRIRLASQLGCGLVGVVYILDEPSIGLHARDHQALLGTLLHLRDMGNTVVVIEHDAATMRAADWLIDLGPDAGILGGEPVAAGTPQQVMANPRSLTGRYLCGARQVTRPQETRREPNGWLTIRGARPHNLKEIDVSFPLGVFCAVSGVSGSGKSSLVRQTLHPALARVLHNAQAAPGPYETIEGLEQVNKVININQDPIGRTPRSNPATYVGVYGEIRKLFASLPEAKARGYKAGRFSFNVKGGRCESCKGYGRKRVEMHFLADVWVTCAACNGSRYNRPTLEVTYHGRSIADVLDMEVQEALDFFAPLPKIANILQTLYDVGLEYIKLGQSALTLSGGEAQRVKLAKELSRNATGRTVYILDEPTTGLHFADIQRLLDVLHQLVDGGNTVIVIEHNLDVINAADTVIDLGPEGGDEGGYVIAQGTPEALSQIAASHTGRFLARQHI